MSFWKELALAGPALVLCLFANHALFGSAEDEHREQGKEKVTISRTWIGADRIAPDRLLAVQSLTSDGPLIVAKARVARQVAPGIRVRQVFAQFAPGERRDAI